MTKNARNIVGGVAVLILALIPLYWARVTLIGGEGEMLSHLSYVKTAHLQKPNLLMLGDSIGYYAQTRLAQNIPGANPANFSFSGDRVCDLRWRITHGELASHPATAIIMIGVNNLLYGMPPAQTAQEIEALIADIQRLSPKTRLLLMGVLPAERATVPSLRQEITELNTLLAGLATRHHIAFKDIGNLLLQPDGSLSPQCYMPDHTHLTYPTYDIWQQAIRPDLLALQQEK